MTIDLSRIDAEPQDFRTEVEIPAERLDADQVASPMSVRLEGVVRSQGSCFVVDGRLEVQGHLVCVRCLDPVPWRSSEVFRIELVRTIEPQVDTDELELADEELDRVVLGDDRLDLDELAAEQVLLALPMRTICRDDCAGLCPTCGANRNRPEACGCEPESDPRWEALQGLTGRPS